MGKFFITELSLRALNFDEIFRRRPTMVGGAGGARYARGGGGVAGCKLMIFLVTLNTHADLLS